MINLNKLSIFLCAMFATLIKDPISYIVNIVSFSLIKNILKAIGITIAILSGGFLLAATPVVPELMLAIFLFTKRKVIDLNGDERTAVWAFLIGYFVIIYPFLITAKGTADVPYWMEMLFSNLMAIMVSLWFAIFFPAFSTIKDLYSFLVKKFNENWVKCSSK